MRIGTSPNNYIHGQKRINIKEINVIYRQLLTDWRREKLKANSFPPLLCLHPEQSRGMGNGEWGMKMWWF